MQPFIGESDRGPLSAASCNSAIASPFCDPLVNEMKIRMSTDELLEIDQGLEPGQNVEIAQGPFQGLEGLVTRLISARDRVEILIEWMGRSLHAETSVADLVPLTESRLK
jgi:hypothetical protein